MKNQILNYGTRPNSGCCTILREPELPKPLAAARVVGDRGIYGPTIVWLEEDPRLAFYVYATTLATGGSFSLETPAVSGAERSSLVCLCKEAGCADTALNSFGASSTVLAAMAAAATRKDVPGMPQFEALVVRRPDLFVSPKEWSGCHGEWQSAGFDLVEAEKIEEYLSDWRPDLAEIAKVACTHLRVFRNGTPTWPR